MRSDLLNRVILVYVSHTKLRFFPKAEKSALTFNKLNKWTMYNVFLINFALQKIALKKEKVKK